MESWVGDGGLLLKFVARPALAFENFLQFTDDHAGTLDQRADCVNSLAYIKCTLHIVQSRYNGLLGHSFWPTALTGGVVASKVQKPRLAPRRASKHQSWGAHNQPPTGAKVGYAGGEKRENRDLCAGKHKQRSRP